MIIRTALPGDIEAMHRIRLAVTENRLVRTVITRNDYLDAIGQDGRGWVAETDGALHGFAIAKRNDWSIWALFVDPACEHRGIGRALHAEMHAWLKASGCAVAWLETEPGTRAEMFYRKAGWQFTHITPEGDAHYEMHFT